MKFLAKKLRSLLCLTALSMTSLYAFAQPANDDPCNATPLTVGSSCSYTAGTTVSATASAGVPAPGCASYTGSDVWYSVVVPPSGVINFDSSPGTITDGGMAVYSGACSSLSLVDCDDDSSPNGLMPMIYLTGQTPGATLYIRVWKYGSGTGTFNICAMEPPAAPPCGSSPPAGDACSNATPICDLNGYCGNTSASYGVDTWSQLTTGFCGSIENNSFLSFTASSNTISFNVWVNSSTMGYGIQIYIFSATNCSGAVTSYGPCYNPGTVPAGPVNITATGLTPGNTYYIMIDGNSGDVCNYTIGADSGILIPVDVSPSAASICPGGSVPLTASGGNGTYTWDASPDLSATTGTNVTATPPTTPGVYSYTVNSSTGNPLCPSSTTATATITVAPCGCTVSATNSGNVCEGTAGTVNLFATNVTGATYSWTGPNGFVSTDQNPTGVVLPTAPGSYDYTVTADDGGTPCTSTTTVIVYALPTVDAGAPQSACSGGSVTLNGSGATSYVWDNGVSNGVSFTPGATTTYTVTGTDANGCVNTDQVTVTVGSNPAVDAGAPQTVCSGTSVTLNGSGAVSYVWDNGVTDGAAFNATSTVTYTVTGTDGSGCQGTDQVTVTVNALPNVDAGAPQSVCTGGTVTLNGSGATSYVWDNSATDGVSFTLGATTTYTVTGTDANGCVNTDQVTVTVNMLPNVDAGAPQSVCAGGNVTLSGSGATSYAWDNSVNNGVAFAPGSTITYTVTGTDANGCVNTDQVTVTVNALPNVDAGAPQTVCAGTSITLSGLGATSYGWTGGVTNGVSFTPAATTTYTVTGTDANGCQNTDQVTVTVNALPTVDAGAPQTVCAGTAITLNGSGASSYGWNNGVTNGVSFTPGATTTYTVTGTDANGCQNTDQVTVTVNALPNVNAGADQSVCAGGSVTLNGSGATSYVWNNGVTNGVAFTPGTTTTYTVTGTDGNGCQDTDQMIVTVNALPNVSAGVDQTICLGTSITLSGSGATSYVWTNGVTNNVAFNPALGTVTYTVTGTDANGCQGTDQIVVLVVPVPVADINSAGPLSGYPGLQVVFTNGSQFGTSFDVDFDNGQNASTTDPSETFTGMFNSPGTYTVVLTASNGICTDTDEMDVIVIPYEPLGVNIPNVFTPDGDGVNDEWFIDVTNGSTIDVLIVNRWENVIMNITDFATHWDGMVNGNEATEGTYFFKYSITGLDGTTQTGQGFVELIRK